MAYSLETLMAIHGDDSRWRTSPWFVIFFLFLVVPMGFVSILLITLQPIIVGFWCSWCLFTALCMLLMIALSMDELMAVIQFLAESKKEGKDLWEIFWKGKEKESGIQINNNHDYMFLGINPAKNLILSLALGLWLIFSPVILNETRIISNLDYIIGSLVVVISVVSMAEVVAKKLKWSNILMGIIILSEVLFLRTGHISFVIHIFAGILLIFLSCIKVKKKAKYGLWDH